MLQAGREQGIPGIQTGRWQRRAIGPSTAAGAKLCGLSGSCIKIASVGRSQCDRTHKIRKFPKDCLQSPTDLCALASLHTKLSQHLQPADASMILNVFLSFWHKMPRSTEHAFQQNQTTLDAGSMCTMKGAPERSRGGHPSWLPIVTRTKVRVCETRCFPKSPLVLPWMWCLEDLENCCEDPCSSSRIMSDEWVLCLLPKDHHLCRKILLDDVKTSRDLFCVIWASQQHLTQRSNLCQQAPATLPQKLTSQGSQQLPQDLQRIKVLNPINVQAIQSKSKVS